MKIAAILLAGSMMVAATGASAASFTTGMLGVPAAGQTLFADFDTLNPAAASQTNSVVLPASVANVGVSVDGSAFLAVLGGGSTTYNFNSSGVSSFSFDAGTIDSYNSLVVTFLGGATQTFSGQGYTGPNTTRAFVTADGAERILSATFASSQNSFEIDNIAVSGAVPEPATWAMMILGMGAVGGAMRRRKSNVAFA